MDEIRFYSIIEVAEMLKLSPQTVTNLIKAGDIPAIRLGRGYRISSDAIRYMTESNLVEVK